MENRNSTSDTKGLTFPLPFPYNVCSGCILILALNLYGCQVGQEHTQRLPSTLHSELNDSIKVKLAALRYLMGLQETPQTAKGPIVFIDGSDSEQKIFQQYFASIGVFPHLPQNMGRDSHKNIIDIETKEQGEHYSISEIEICGDNATALGSQTMGTLSGYFARLHLRKEDGSWRVVAVSNEWHA